MKELLLFSLIIWIPPVIVLAKKALWNLYFWQIKEYRWDRLIDHLHWDQDDHNRNKYALGLKFILFAGATLLFSLPYVAFVSIFLAYVTWISEGISYFSKAIGNTLERPSIKSPRNILVLSLFIVCISTIIITLTQPFANYWFAPTGGIVLDSLNTPLNESLTGFNFVDAYLYLGFTALVALFLDLIIPFIIAFFVLLTAPISVIRREFTIWKAEKKWRHLKSSVKLIGITGSQGKTTLKEILSYMLEKKYNVAKTPENYNTDYGVAYAVTNHVSKRNDFFVAEMGAYRVGEIKKIVKSFPPDISVITDLDLQHVSLFGSEERLYQAKAEIARYMKPGGLAVLNGDNENIEKLEAVVPGEVALVFTDKDKYETLTKDNKITSHAFLVENIKHKKKLSFDLSNEDGDTEHFSINVQGAHLVTSFAQAILIAHAAGLSFEEIKAILKDFDMEMPRMSIETGDNGTIILNNTYNSSRKGLKAAIQTLNEIYDGKHEEISYDTSKAGMRILVTKGIIELGEKKREVYEELATFAKEKIDAVITTDFELAKAFKKNAKKVFVISVKNYDAITYAYRETAGAGDVVLLEGRLKPSVLANIVSDKR